jgi:amino acid adenylation domain-containing protein
VNAPKGTLTAELRSQITEHKAELLTLLRDQAFSASFVSPSIPHRTTNEPAPLSFAQERLWFLEQLDPGTAVYNICRASRLIGSLNVAALDASLREIVQRHEVLRSAIHLVDDRPLQITVSKPNFMVHLIDLRAVTLVERDEEIRRRIKEEVERPFDLLVGVFLRCTLLHVEDDEHVLILTTHHIVSDAWSMGLLRRELWALYEAYAKSKPSSLRNLLTQYSDYAVWQRSRLLSDVLDSHLSYWKTKLEGIPVLDLPSDRPRTTQRTYHGARKRVALPESLTKRLKDLSERSGVTLFMTMVAAFNVLLYRYTTQEDIAIGTPVANRSKPELNELIGLFVNTLVLRTNLSDNPTFSDLLIRVRDTCLEAYAHQELPFEKLVEELHPDRESGRTPLFQVMFVLNNAPQAAPEIFGIKWHRVEVEPGTAKFDLTLALGETNGRLEGSIEYSTDIFDRPTIERFTGHWRILLEGIVDNPNQPISTLPVLTGPERHQLLVTWNSTAAEYPKDSCIHELFEAQVKRTPNAIALAFEAATLTYQQLNQRANQLAHYLSSLKVGPETLVGIYIERSLEMVVGLLAILKAGGAYVPLDPTYPRDRLTFMMDDSKASVLLSSRKLPPKFLNFNGISVTLEDLPLLGKQNDENPNSRARVEDPAYIVYTSGSTGTPKGVIGVHRGAVNRMAWMWRAYPFGVNEKSCIKTSLTFVDSVWEIFGPLLQGVPTLIIPDDIVKDTRSFVRMLADHRVTRIVLVPSLLRAILDAQPNLQKELPHQIIWTSSGEHLPREIADRFRNSLPNHILLNLYGASEVSADVTHINCSTQMQLPGHRVSIGRPISNTRIYLLDSRRELVPIGISGELYVGGAGLARGYLNRLDLTAEKFIVDPFGIESDSRLYRTGDLARYLPDGMIELLGRTDRQVKIRGYRVELGEIETCLNQHPQVKESLVVADGANSTNANNPNYEIENPKSNKRLVGYVVLRDLAAFPVAELRNFLKEKLPGHMIPSALVFIKGLPLTPNGKFDLKALPSPDEARSETAQTFVAPRTEVEELVAQTWQEVLKADHVGIHDNFFDIGGHSILAIQIVSRLRDAFNREIRVRTLFEKPTVGALASEIEGLIRDGSAPEFPPIMPVARNVSLALSANQEQMWRLDKVIPGTHVFNMPYVYQVRCELNPAALESALKQIVQRHEALRTVFGEVNGNPVQVAKDGSDFRMLVVDLQKYSAEKSLERAAALILEEREQPFNLELGPLIRATLLRLTASESCLLLTLHHIIGDHWSMQVLRRELAAIYESIVQARSLDLPQLSIQFGDFASWERQVSDGDAMMRQVTYWKEQLSEPLLQLQFQNARRKKVRSTDRGKTQEIEITGALFAAVKSLANKECCTVSMITLTALTILLYSYTHQPDICIGTLIANRRCSETEGVFGHFVNTVVIRTRISPGITCTQLLKQVRATMIEAYSHQELPFEKLAEVLEEERNIDRASLFQVLCNYQKVQPEPPHPTGITIAPFKVARVVGFPELSITPIEMIFDATEMPTMLTLSVNWRSGVLNKSQRSRMKEQFTNILHGLVLQTATVESDGIDAST